MANDTERDDAYWQEHIEPTLRNARCVCTLWGKRGEVFWMAGLPQSQASNFAVRELMGSNKSDEWSWAEGFFVATSEAEDHDKRIFTVYGKHWKRLWGSREGPPVLLIGV